MNCWFVDCFFNCFLISFCVGFFFVNTLKSVRFPMQLDLGNYRCVKLHFPHTLIWYIIVLFYLTIRSWISLCVTFSFLEQSNAYNCTEAFRASIDHRHSGHKNTLFNPLCKIYILYNARNKIHNTLHWTVHLTYLKISLSSLTWLSGYFLAFFSSKKALA